MLYSRGPYLLVGDPHGTENMRGLAVFQVPYLYDCCCWGKSCHVRERFCDIDKQLMKLSGMKQLGHPER